MGQAPLSSAFSYEFSQLRHELTNRGAHWFSSYDNIPAALFSGVSQRCTIWISDARGCDLFTTRLLRWRSAYRPSLIENMAYVKLPDGFQVKTFGIPRLANNEGEKLLRLHIKASASGFRFAPGDVRGVSSLGFSPTARNFISTYLEAPPVVDANTGNLLEPSQGAWLSLPSQESAFAALAATTGDACFWYWLTRGDGFHVTNWLLADFLSPLSSFPTGHFERLRMIGELLHLHRFSALVFKKNAGKYVGNYNYQHLRKLTRKADIVFLAGLGASWAEIEQLFSHVALVRAINEEAGEKNIPSYIKDRFPPPDSSGLAFDHTLREIDEWVCTLFSVEPERIRVASYF